MKILIFIEHDVMIRHFIDSQSFNSLINEHQVVFIFPEKGHKRVTRKIDNRLLNAPYLHLTINQKRQKIWKRLFQVNLLRWKKGQQHKALRIFHREMIGWKAALHYSLLALPGLYYLFRYYSFFQIKNETNIDLQNLIYEEKPDLIIHPSVLEGVFINDLVDVSQNSSIPLVVIMNSWDNPSTKRAMIGTPDWLLVWGEQTKKHAIKYVEMEAQKVFSFGAAQFEVYKKPPRINRDRFCKIHNIDPKMIILLYAGSSKNTDEYTHLLLIDDAIEQGSFGDMKVVYRPHPWGGGGKGGERIIEHKWKNICIESSMKNYLMNLNGGHGRMSFPDYYDTHDVLSSVDIIISPLSTILLEGAIHGKPVLCFLPKEEKHARHFQLDSSLIHFQDMFNMSEFLIAEGHSELIPMIEVLVNKSKDSEFKDNLNKVCNYFVQSFEKSYDKRLLDFCENIAIKSC